MDYHIIPLPNINGRILVAALREAASTLKWSYRQSPENATAGRIDIELKTGFLGPAALCSGIKLDESYFQLGLYSINLSMQDVGNLASALHRVLRY